MYCSRKRRSVTVSPKTAENQREKAGKDASRRTTLASGVRRHRSLPLRSSHRLSADRLHAHYFTVSADRTFVCTAHIVNVSSAPCVLFGKIIEFRYSASVTIISKCETDTCNKLSPSLVDEKLVSYIWNFQVFRNSRKLLRLKLRIISKVFTREDAL